jgi:hypothetical protein
LSSGETKISSAVASEPSERWMRARSSEKFTVVVIGLDRVG